MRTSLISIVASYSCHELTNYGPARSQPIKAYHLAYSATTNSGCPAAQLDFHLLIILVLFSRDWTDSSVTYPNTVPLQERTRILDLTLSRGCNIYPHAGI